MSSYLFSEYSLSEVLGNRLQKVRNEVDALNEDYLLNASETDLVTHPDWLMRTASSL
jgi:hypothetical protein